MLSGKLLTAEIVVITLISSPGKVCYVECSSIWNVKQVCGFTMGITDTRIDVGLAAASTCFHGIRTFGRSRSNSMMPFGCMTVNSLWPARGAEHLVPGCGWVGREGRYPWATSLTEKEPFHSENDIDKIKEFGNKQQPTYLNYVQWVACLLLAATRMAK